MWFAYVAAVLVLLAIGGLYVRRRLTGALVHFGVRRRRVRVVRWAAGWLLFGFPIVVIAAITPAHESMRPVRTGAKNLRAGVEIGDMCSTLRRLLHRGQQVHLQPFML